jgi:predicted enzyme related to lactoylglutathione lyase
MTSGLQSIVFPVTDLNKAKAVFGALLRTEPHTDTPYYVGYRIGDLEVALAPPSGPNEGLTGPAPVWFVEDIKSSLQELVDAGAEKEMDIMDVGAGNLLARVKDADGNAIGLMQGA